MFTILVTGGAGFIGSNFIRFILSKHSDYQIINIDLLTYAGNLINLADLDNKQNYIFIKADICNRNDIEQIFKKYEINFVINFAAESHVDRSIIEPNKFINTNILGTEVLLDVAKESWKLDKADKYSKLYKSGVKFIQISTDEVYGALGDTGLFVETSTLLPNSPYSASKASADLLVRAYHKTYGLPINITRCSNNYGPFQFPEKLIPLIIINCKNTKKLPIYGDGLQVRDWIHVLDHCSAIETVLEKGTVGEIYNIGGNNEKTNIEIVKMILKKLRIKEDLILYVKDRPGHDRRYAIDNTKITTKLGWKPMYTFEFGLQDTIEWYISNTSWVDNIISGKYKEYYEMMYD